MFPVPQIASVSHVPFIFISSLAMAREVYCVHLVNLCRPKTLFWDAKSEEWLYLGI